MTVRVNQAAGGAEAAQGRGAAPGAGRGGGRCGAPPVDADAAGRAVGYGAVSMGPSRIGHSHPRITLNP
ncbi:hypothetical protein GCM10023082_29100 [Streptomyces tremellae]|uniref:Uncharacterized protein n=1 Tax=Streptomyces tremellae TaxID=1124239 RepID=A0ABP7F1G5_9ACTN